MASNWGIVNRDEIYRFTNALNQYQQGMLDEESFTAQRLQFGIYGQRQEHQFMVRIKIPGGILDREQLQCIGQLTEKYSTAEFANITTRQDIQLHFVSLKDIPKILLRLSDAGLTTREACGNTVRNITACPMAGNCPQENQDIRPLLNKTTIHFLRHPLTQHLPRKFKMSFSGCESDCAMGLIHDLAVIAVKRGEQIGFKILVGGGLGHKPREAFVLEEFVEEEQVIAVIESVIMLHNRYSDRTKRAKSRLKFLVERFGKKLFKEKYQQIYKMTEHRLQQAEANQQARRNTPVGWCNVDFKRIRDFSEEKTVLKLNVPLGDLSPQYIRRICQTMEKFGLNQLRTTQGQDLLLLDVPPITKDKLVQTVKMIDEQSVHSVANAVACPGSWTCRLGITASRDMASLLAKQVSSLKVNVSGCHNSCAQPQISDVGLHGEGRRKFGKLLPYYRLYLGGNGSMNGGFALKGPEIPAARVATAIHEIEQRYKSEQSNGLIFREWVKSKSPAYFDALLERFVIVTNDDIAELLRDEGDKKDFRVLQLGGGECAGIAEETVAAYMAEIRYEKQFSEIFMRQNELLAALECAENMINLLVKSVTYKKGKSIDETSEQTIVRLKQKLVGYPDLIATYLKLHNRMDVMKVVNDKDLIERFLKDLDVWHANVINALDETRNTDAKIPINQFLDLSNDSPPMQYLKAKQRFNLIENGNSLKMILSSGSDVDLLFKGLETKGFQFLSMKKTEDSEHTILHMLKPVNFKKIREVSVGQEHIA